MALAFRELHVPTQQQALSGFDAKLSGREYLNLILLACGTTEREAATYLNTTPRMVQSHKMTLFSKLGVVDSLQAVVGAMSHDVFDPRGLVREGFDWSPFDNLSKGEREVLDLWLDSKGETPLSSPIVAAALGKSESTIGNRLIKMGAETGLSKRAELALHYFVYRNNLFDEEGLNTPASQKRPLLTENPEPSSARFFQELTVKPLWEMDPQDKIIFAAQSLGQPLTLAQLRNIVGSDTTNIFDVINGANNRLGGINHALLIDNEGLRLYELPPEGGWPDEKAESIADKSALERVEPEFLEYPELQENTYLYNHATKQWGIYLGKAEDGEAKVRFGKPGSKHEYTGTVPLATLHNSSRFYIKEPQPQE